jgi:hypothetical protein
MTNREFYADLAEAYFHGDTMVISPMEIQWLKDYEQTIKFLSPDEREALENAPAY